MSDEETPPDHSEAPTQAATPARFEQALAELEQLVEHLESGDLSLEESLTHFERGIGLARECRESLQAAEQKVQILLDQEGNGELTDYDNANGQQDS